jgi:hypothetical protein
MPQCVSAGGDGTKSPPVIITRPEEKPLPRPSAREAAQSCGKVRTKATARTPAETRRKVAEPFFLRP